MTGFVNNGFDSERYNIAVPFFAHMLAALKLFRPVNCLMSFAAVLVGGWAFADWEADLALLSAALVWAVFTASANMINDAFDVEIDRVNHPDRLLARGVLKPTRVLLMAGFIMMPALLLAAVVGVKVLALVTVCLVLVYAYEKWLKRRGLAGNIVVGLLVASGFVAGGLVMDNLPVAVLVGFLAFLANTGREVVKDMEDEKGDMGRASVVKVHGRGAALAMAWIFFLSPVALGLLVFFPLGLGGWVYLTFILLAGAFLTAAALGAHLNPGLSQRSAKLGMLLALFAFLF